MINDVQTNDNGEIKLFYITPLKFFYFDKPTTVFYYQRM